MGDMTIKDVLRARCVDRWVMVDVTNRQNIAEHSFNVTMLAIKLCEHMGVSPIVRDQVMWYALTHDLSEIFTGDIPTPTKRMFCKETKQRFEQMEYNLTFAGRHLKTPNPLVIQIVKCADYVEALLFLSNQTQTEQVRNTYNWIYDEYNEYIARLGHQRRYVERLFNEALTCNVTELEHHAI